MQRGDVIYVLHVFDSGLCHGVLRNHVGIFRLSDVETIADDGTLLATSRRSRAGKTRHQPRRAKPKTVEELLHRLGLQVAATHATLRYSQIMICSQDRINALRGPRPKYFVRPHYAYSIEYNKPFIMQPSYQLYGNMPLLCFISVIRLHSGQKYTTLFTALSARPLKPRGPRRRSSWPVAVRSYSGFSTRSITIVMNEQKTTSSLLLSVIVCSETGDAVHD